jgi:outer membrane lipoprotein SlyB
LSTVLAYLDAGSGSMILQLLLGGVAAIGVALKMYWNRVLRLLRIRKDDPSEAIEVQEHEQAAAPAVERQKVER